MNMQCCKLKLQTLKGIGITPIKPLSPLHKILNEIIMAFMLKCSVDCRAIPYNITQLLIPVHN